MLCAGAVRRSHVPVRRQPQRCVAAVAAVGRAAVAQLLPLCACLVQANREEAKHLVQASMTDHCAPRWRAVRAWPHRRRHCLRAECPAGRRGGMASGRGDRPSDALGGRRLQPHAQQGHRHVVQLPRPGGAASLQLACVGPARCGLLSAPCLPPPLPQLNSPSGPSGGDSSSPQAARGDFCFSQQRPRVLGCARAFKRAAGRVPGRAVVHVQRPAALHQRRGLLLEARAVGAAPRPGVRRRVPADGPAHHQPRVPAARLHAQRGAQRQGAAEVRERPAPGPTLPLRQLEERRAWVCLCLRGVLPTLWGDWLAAGAPAVHAQVH